MDLQKRAQEAALSELADNMSPTAIFNRFDLSASENFLSKSSLSTPVAPRLKTKALLLMSVNRCEGVAEASGFVDVLFCK
jgi:hypothetical protein